MPRAALSITNCAWQMALKWTMAAVPVHLYTEPDLLR
jgi:hypothetical protein